MYFLTGRDNEIYETLKPHTIERSALLATKTLTTNKSNELFQQLSR